VVVVSFSLLLIGLWNANIVREVIRRILPPGM